MVLLNALMLAVGPDQSVKDGKHMPAIFKHPREDASELRFALCIFVPLCENGCRHSNIPAKLVRRMSAQEQPVEKRSFALRKA